MKKQLCRWIAVLAWLIIALRLVACAGENDTGPPETTAESQADGFACHTVGAYGSTIQGFYRETDGIWYLFVPAAQSIQDTVLYCQGDVAAVSEGVLDMEKDTISQAFQQSGDHIELTLSDGGIHTVTVMQSRLPGVQIYLKDTSLAEIHQDKDVKYGENALILTDPSGRYDMHTENGVEIKGRGNSTWTLSEKKGYQIKFGEKISVLGMRPAKKWILLANSFDDSMLRSQLVYRMAASLDMAYVPTFEYVDLWIDGEYLGTYLLGEKVEIGSSRLNLKQVDGALFEHDEGFYNEEDHWFFSTILQRHFTLKEIVKEEDANIEGALRGFEKSVGELASYLYTTPSKQVTLDELATMIDVDSFAKYYLINEYVLNRESFVSSFYWYKDGSKDVIHLGPIWDFDTCMGNDGPDYTQYYADNHMLFKYLLAIPEFHARIEELYTQYRDEFTSMTSNAKTIAEEISDSAMMNYLRWDIWGKPNPKAPDVHFQESFEEAVAAVEAWLKGREDYFAITDSMTVTSEVSEDGRTMEIFFDDEGQYTGVQFTVWTPVGDQSLAQWYPAERIDGVWYYTVDLEEFGTSGIYYINVNADGEPNVVASGCNYVEKEVK